MKKQYPKVGAIYTLGEICNSLYLRDSPALMITLDGREGCVQNSHLSDEELLAVPGIAETKWRYIRETHEWIPVFRWADSGNPRDVIDVEPLKDEPEQYLWTTPKGFPREQ